MYVICVIYCATPPIPIYFIGKGYGKSILTPYIHI
jgi:hypothetical protein